MGKTTTDPTMVKVDLVDLMEAGVLMAANEIFFWPLGLALTWEVPTLAVDPKSWCRDHRTHEAHNQTILGGIVHCAGTVIGHGARNLHVTEWKFEDGRHETIALDAGDPVAITRREAFLVWFEKRITSMPAGERGISWIALGGDITRIQEALEVARNA